MPTRYYSEEKERLEKIKSKYKESDSTDEYVPNANFRREWNNKNSRAKTSNKSSNIRLVAIIGLLALAAWYLLIRNNDVLM